VGQSPIEESKHKYHEGYGEI
jgi:hypothetical protein